MLKRILVASMAVMFAFAVQAETSTETAVQATQVSEPATPPALDLNRVHDYLLNTFGQKEAANIERTIFDKRLAGTVTCTGGGPTSTYGGAYTYTGTPSKVSLIFVTFDGNFARTYLDNQTTCFYAFDAKAK